MRSFIAALRTLVLPFGATTGRRIVLDGINGLITIFDAGNNERIVIGESGDSIELITGTVGEATGGQLKAIGVNAGQPDAQAELEIISPSLAAPDNKVAAIILASEADDGVAQPSIFMDAETVTFSPVTIANGIRVELLGTLTASARLHVGGGTAFPSIDIFQGVVDIETDGDIQIDDLSLPRGFNGTIATKNTDTTINATAGTWTDVLTLDNYQMRAGRRYELVHTGGHSFASAGSGFAVGDGWEFELQIDVGAGFVNPTHPDQRRVRANVAIAARWPVPHLTAIHDCVSDVLADVKMRARKQSGAATVTSSISAGANPHALYVKDIGAV
jgi:hypothetical protein